MLHSHLGELASFATAICWTVSPIAFEYAGRKVGHLSVNYIRLVVAFLFISIYTLFTRGIE